MGKRRLGRTLALQLLYQVDTRGAFDESDSMCERFFDHLEPAVSEESRNLARALYDGVLSNLERVDTLIDHASQHWRIERMSQVDRNVLRLACYELLERTDVPTGVVINEAIELGKAFGASESSAFVNGVLDRIAADLARRV